MALGANANLVNIIIRARDQTRAAFAKAKTSIASTNTATSKLNKGLSGLNGGFSRISSSLSSFGVALGPVGIAVAAVGVAMATLGGAAIKSSLEFEKATATIRVGTGATGVALEGLMADFHAVYGDIPGTAEAISSALTAMSTTTGASGTALQDLTTNIMNASRMLGEDGAGNAQAFGEAMKQWQTPAASGVGLMEQFFKITQETGIEFGELTSAMNAYGPVLQNAGFTAAQSAELFGRLEGSGIAVSRVMPGLNASFRKWAEEGKNGKDALEATIATVKNAKTNMEALTIATATFGAEGAQRMMTAVRNGTFELSSLGEMLEGTEGVISKTSEATLQFGDKWTLFKNKVMTAITPIGDIITGALGAAMQGLSEGFKNLQTVISAVTGVFDAFFGAIQSAVSSALAPLAERIMEIQSKFEGATGKLTIFGDIITIITAGAKWLGEAIGTLLSMALTPLVDKLKAAIDMLTAFYDKLGPIKALMEGGKDLFGGILEGIHNIAESTKETKEPIEELKKGLEELAEESSKAPKAVADAWALAIKDFQEGTGSYKEAIGGIKEKITELTEEWMTATDKRKTAIEKEVRILEAEEDALEDLKKTAEDALSSTAKETEEATEKMEEFTVTIGDTSIEFKGAAAEVVKNADAYKKLQDSAQKIMDLDWSVFTEFEASLPNIEAGIGDMSSSFTGFRDVLESNIEKLVNVKESVMDIGEIAAPFLEAGFSDSVKTIGNFANALSDAGSAINTFGNLTEVNVEGCINFSTSVYSMVSALGVLKTQMHDMKPVFADMEAGMRATLEAFVYPGGVTADIEAKIREPYAIAEGILKKNGVSIEAARSALHEKYEGLRMPSWVSEDPMHYALVLLGVPEGDLSIFDKANEEFNRAILDIKGTERPFVVALKTKEYDLWKELGPIGDDIDTFASNIVHSSSAIEIAVNKQVSSLNYWSGQLIKITDALKPYLDFMRTLNEITALSTLSIDDINAGFDAITGTLVNLSSALEKVDFAPVMESLFGESLGDFKFAGGAATDFIKLMQPYSPKLNELTTYTDNLSGAISNLVIAFDALSNMEDRVLMDTDALAKVFENIKDIMNNLSNALSMEGGNFATILTTAVGDLLKAADPLLVWFRKNSVQVTELNTVMSTFMLTIKHVVDTMQSLQEMSKMIVPDVDELGAGFDRAKEFVDAFDKALMEHIGMTRGEEYNTYKLEKLYDNVFTSIMRFADDWARIEKEMGASFKTFDKGTATIITLVSSITSLVEAFKTLADMPLITSDQIVAGFEKIKDTIEEVNKCMKQFAAEGLSELVASLESVAKQWLEWDEKLGDSDSTFGEAVTGITALVTAITDLIDVQKRLVELEGVSDTEWESLFYTLTEHIYNFYEGMAEFGEAGIAALTYNLNGIEKVWQSWIEELGDSLTSFDDATSKISGLGSSILSVIGVFTSLMEMPVMTARTFSAGMKDMTTNIINFASSLKDNLDTIEESLKKVDDAWSDNAEEMNRLLPIFDDATSDVNTLAGGILSVVRSFESLKEIKFEEVFATGFKNLTNATGEFATALKNNIDGLLTSLTALVTAWLENEEETVRLMRAFITISSNFIIVIGFAKELQNAFSSMATGSVLAGIGFKKLIGFMNEVIKGVKELYTTEAASDLSQFVIDVGLVISALADLETSINTAMGLIHTKIETTVNDAKSKVDELSNIPGNAYTWGADIIYSFVDGMKAMEFYLIAELQRLGMLIAFYLGVGSNTKLGALSHLTDWPKNLVKTFADGIKKGTPEISKALSSLTLPAENLHIPGGYAGMLGGGGNTVTMYNTWNVDSQQNADYAISEMERMLTRKRVL